jgi:hypothetical protein
LDEHTKVVHNIFTHPQYLDSRKAILVSTIELVATRVGQPTPIGELPHGAGPRWSSIGRSQLFVPTVYVTPTGLSGDLPTETNLKDPDDPGAGQIHGGFDKALYVYPEEHYAEWLAELGAAGLGERSFGENWLIRGALETDVHIGDIWELAEARFEVSKVRTPCVTLEAYFGGRQHMVRRMTANRRCGWYLRVRKPGIVPTSGDYPCYSPQHGRPDRRRGVRAEDENSGQHVARSADHQLPNCPTLFVHHNPG